jgi:hypothetical protein
MSFPTNPTNGQQAIVNNVVYTYNSTKDAWVRTSNASATLTFDKLVLTNSGSDSLTTNGGITTSGNIFAGTTNGNGYRMYVNNNGAGTTGTMYVSASVGSSGNGVVIDSTARSVFDNAVPMLHLIARDGSVALSTTVRGNTVIGATTSSTSSDTGALVVRGGVGIAGEVIAAGNIVASSPIPSTSTTTGALVVAGGIGVAGNINASGLINTTGNISTTNNLTAARVNNTGQFYYNTRTISANVTIGATENAMSIGPMTIADGVEVVINDGGEWSIV